MAGQDKDTVSLEDQAPQQNWSFAKYVVCFSSLLCIGGVETLSKKDVQGLMGLGVHLGQTLSGIWSGLSW
ncbi:hypothetical protein SLE2022_104160 [Rubroshorea leprosula]